MALTHSISEQVYKHLREDIMLGKIPAGQKLILRDLQAQFEVSCTPVREALSRLAQDHFVDYVTNQGATVIDLSSQDISDLIDLCRLYDCYALDCVIRLPDKTQMCEELQAAIDRQRFHVERPSGKEKDKEYSQVYNEFHEILYSYADNHWLANEAMQKSSLLFLAYVKHRASGFPLSIVHEHQAVLDAIKADDLPLAISCMKEHRENEKKRYICGR